MCMEIDACMEIDTVKRTTSAALANVRALDHLGHLLYAIGSTG